MSDDELMALIISVDPQAVRLPPGIKAIADRIEQASRRAALEEIAAWIEPQRNDVAAHGFEFADAIRALANGDKHG